VRITNHNLDVENSYKLQKDIDLMSKKIVREVIVDTPTSEDLFHGKGHERTALSLADAIMSFDNDDRAIGLDGPWGSGKSSIVEIAARHLASIADRKKIHHHFFTFDIWKSQGTGFRRSFLEHFVSWAMTEFPKNKTQLQQIEEDIHGKRREVTTSNQPILGWFGIIILFLLPILPIYYLWTKTVFDELAKAAGSSWLDYATSVPAYIFGVFIFGVLCATLKKKYIDHSGNIGFKTALSSTLLISSKQHQDHKAIQKIREIDPNDYEFHTTLRQILRTVQSDQRKVVVVLDNIDRLPQKEIMEYWALVRSIFSGTYQSGKIVRNETITAIVPYDRAHIEDSMNKDDEASSKEKAQTLTRLSSREIFSKTFDEVLIVAPPVLSNAREFFANGLEKALPNHVSKDGGFRTYRIFTELLRAEGGLTTPRQVVSFVNDVSGLYALHEGLFSLPTIAAYLAHQDLISKNPGVLNDYANLDRKIVDLASDPELAKNLAAIVFNVTPDLAFEVLLDNELISAIIASSPEELGRLLNSPGFDLRIDDVIASNSEEWVLTGDFGSAILNLANTMPGYRGAAKPRVLEALIKAFNGIEVLSVNDKAYRPLLSLFDIVGERDRPELLRQLLEKVFVGISKTEDVDFDTGRAFATFLGTSREHMQSLGLDNQFKNELGKMAPDPTADFLYGLALNISDYGLSFNDFGATEISLPKEGNYYAEIATRDPESVLVALKQFSMKSILNESDWIEVSNACIQGCFDKERPQDEIADLLALTCFTRSRVAQEKRAEISLTTALADGQFFRNLGMGDSEESAEAIAMAVFLAGETDLGKQIAMPSKLLPNKQRSQDPSEEYTQFNEILTGNSALSDAQAELVSKKAEEANSMIDVWTKFGSENKSHATAQLVVKAGYLADSVPDITILGLNLYFDYLMDVLGEEALLDMLKRFSARVSVADVSNMKLEQVNIGFVSATHSAAGENWKIYHNHIEKQFQSISSEDWAIHIATFDKTSQLLIEMISTSGCSLDSAKFREPLVQAMLVVLSGTLNSSAPENAFDTLILAIDSNYHDNIWRTLREKVTDVSAVSLEAVVRLFPQTPSKSITEGDRVIANEKDNIIRYFLCPSLEANIKFVLKVFIELGNKRITDFKKYSNESTIRLLDGTLDSFSKSNDNRAWTQQVMEVVQGKRRARSFLDVLWGINKEEE
jgi:hypothetical protein